MQPSFGYIQFIKFAIGLKLKADSFKHPSTLNIHPSADNALLL